MRSLLGYGDPWFTLECEYIAIEAIILCVLIFVAICFESIHHCLAHRFMDHGEKKIELGKIVPIEEKSDEGHGDKKKKSIFQALNPLKAKKHDDHPINHVKEAKKKSYGSRLFHRCEGEIMVLGILAMFVWFSNKCGIMALTEIYNKGDAAKFGPSNGSDMLHMVEDVHMHLFFGMLLYFVCVSNIMKRCQAKIDSFEDYENRMDKEVLEMTKEAITQGKAGRSFRATIPAETKTGCYGICGGDEYREFLMIRKYFIDFLKNGGMGYKLPGFAKYNESSFPFNDYMLLAFDRDVDEFIEFKKTSWLSVCIVYVLIALISWTQQLDDALTTLSSRIFIILSMTIMGALMINERIQANKMMKEVNARLEKSDVDVENGQDTEKPKNSSCGGAALETFLLQSIQSLLFYCSYYSARWILRLVAKAGKNTQDWSDSNVWIEMTITLTMQAICQFIVPKWYPRYCVIMALPPNFDSGDSDVLEKALINWEAHYEGEQEYIEELMKKGRNIDNAAANESNNSEAQVAEVEPLVLQPDGGDATTDAGATTDATPEAELVIVGEKEEKTGNVPEEENFL